MSSGTMSSGTWIRTAIFLVGVALAFGGLWLASAMEWSTEIQVLILVGILSVAIWLQSQVRVR